jgi:chromosomal replication initiator protein
MRDELGQVGYETWIGPLNFVAHQGSTVTVEAPNRFFRDWINDRYLSMMRAALSAEAGGEIEVRLTLGANAAVAPPQQRPNNAH